MPAVAVEIVEAALIGADGAVVQVLDLDLEDGCNRLRPQRPVRVADVLRVGVEPLVEWV